jgi:antitoxin VapB
MPLNIRDERAAKLARRLAERKGISMTEAVIEALESALLRGERPLPERLAESRPMPSVLAIRAGGGH